MVSSASGVMRWTHALKIASALSFLTVTPGMVVGQTVEVPSRMVDVDGDSTRVAVLGMERRGPGEPVLVIWAGGGVTIQGWRGFLQQAAELAPLVTWDGNGIGATPFNGLSWTPARSVERAHAVLSTLEIPPPYILVGHSWGAVEMIYYVGEHPEEVAGMVYLDPTSFRLEPYEWANASSEEEYRAYWDEWEQELASMNPSPGLLAELRAHDVWLQTPVRDRSIPPDPDVPTAVLIGGQGDKTGEELQAEHPTLRESRTLAWVSSLPRGLFMLSTKAGHYVHIDDPEAALSALRWVLGQARSGR